MWVWMTRSPNVCRIAPSTPIAWSHAVGAAHAEVDARRSRSGRAAARGSRSPRARAPRQAQQSSRRRRRRRARHAGGAARRRVWSSAWALRERCQIWLRFSNFSAVPATDSPTDTDAVGAATAPTAGADTGNGPPGAIRRPPDRGRRSTRSELRGDDQADQRARRRLRRGRADRQGRGAGRHRLQVGGRHPRDRAVDPRSVDPADEVSLGDRVDALVLTKEDAEGRLILSKKRARFEKAWRRIEAAAGSGEPVEGTVIEVVKEA